MRKLRCMHPRKVRLHCQDRPRDPFEFDLNFMLVLYILILMQNGTVMFRGRSGSEEVCMWCMAYLYHASRNVAG